MSQVPLSSVDSVELVEAADGQHLDRSATYFYARNCSEKNITIVFRSSIDPGDEWPYHRKDGTHYVVHRRQEILIGPMPEEWSGKDGRIEIAYSDTESLYVAAIRSKRRHKAQG